MKKFKVSLTKSYLVDVIAENEDDAKQAVEVFTGDISDISELKDRKEFNFRINEIDCVVNEAFECEEIDVNLDRL